MAGRGGRTAKITTIWFTGNHHAAFWTRTREVQLQPRRAHDTFDLRTAQLPSKKGLLHEDVVIVLYDPATLAATDWLDVGNSQLYRHLLL